MNMEAINGNLDIDEYRAIDITELLLKGKATNASDARAEILQILCDSGISGLTKLINGKL